MNKDKSVFVMLLSMQCHHCISFLGKDRMLCSENKHIHEGVRYNSEFMRNVLKLRKDTQLLTAIAIVFKTMKMDSVDDILEFTTFDIVGDSTVISTIHRLSPDNKYTIERIFDDYNPGKSTYKMASGGKAEFAKAVSSKIAKVNWRKMIRGFPSFLLVDCEEWNKGLNSNYVPKSVNIFKQTFDDGVNTIALDAKVSHRNMFEAIDSYIEFEE